MKYFKTLIIMFLLVISSSLLFGCKEEQPLQLSTPNIAEVICEQETGRILLITDENPYATSYVFGICEMDEYKNDITKFLRYETDKNYLDVKHIFNYPKNYYFYVQAIGNEKYLDSPYSQITTFTNIFELATPTLTCINNVLSWTTIKHVHEYQLFLNNQLLCTTTQNTFDIASHNDGAFLTSNIPLNFQVKAIAKPNTTFIDSNLSNTAKVTSHLAPVAPSLSINGNTISWANVRNATSYEIQVSSLGTQTYLINSNATTIVVDITNFSNEIYSNLNLVENLGDYSIKVKALGRYDNSDFSNVVNYTTTTQLQAPQILNVNKNTNKNSLDIEIKITDENVASIYLSVNKLGIVLYSSNHLIESNQFTISLSLTNLNLNSIDELTNLTISCYSVQNGKYYKQSTTSTAISSF